MSGAAAFVALPTSDPGHEAALKALKVADLKAVCGLLGLSQQGRKEELADRIRVEKTAVGGPSSGSMPTTQAELLALGHDELQAACLAAGLSDAGTDSELQSRLNAHLFKSTDSRTPEEKVNDSCDAEMGALLLKVAPGAKPEVHSAVGGWLASALYAYVGRTVTTKALRRCKVTFRAGGKAYDDTVYVDAMTRGDAGFVSFVTAVLSRLTTEVPLPTSPELVDMDDAEDAVVELLTALQTPRASASATPTLCDPGLTAALQSLAAGKQAAKPEVKFDNAAFSAATAVLRSKGYFVCRYQTPRLSQVDLVVAAVGAKTDGKGTPQLAVDPRAQPGVLRPMVDSRGNFVVDQMKMVPQADGTYVEATTAETGAVKKNRSTMDVAQGHLLYWTGHLLASTQVKELHHQYDGRTSTEGVWLHPYHVGKLQTLLWRLVPKVTGDALEGIITPLLQHVQELVNSGAKDAWTGDMALEYIMEKLAEQVNFAATLSQKRKADGPTPGGKDKKPQGGNGANKTLVRCTVCKTRNTGHVSKVCLPCKNAAEAAGAPAGGAVAGAAARAAGPGQAADGPGGG